MSRHSSAARPSSAGTDSICRRVLAAALERMAETNAGPTPASGRLLSLSSTNYVTPTNERESIGSPEKNCRSGATFGRVCAAGADGGGGGCLFGAAARVGDAGFGFGGMIALVRALIAVSQHERDDF